MLPEQYSIMMNSKFNSTLQKNDRENGTETKCIMEKNAFEVLLHLYRQCKHHTKDAFMYINGFISEACQMCMASCTSLLHVHGNVNNSKPNLFVYKIRPALSPNAHSATTI